MSRRTLEPLPTRKRRLFLHPAAKLGVNGDVRGARHPGADRRAPAPVARADRRGAEGVRRAGGACARAIARRRARFPTSCRSSAPSCRCCARRSAQAAAAEPGRPAHGRGLPALRGRIRHADGGGGRLGRRRAAGGDARRRAARPRLRQRRRRHRRLLRAGASARHRRSPAISRCGPIPARSGTIRIRHGDGVGGIATSGARGRSFSLGIADSVTVLAADAATADAAATLIANAVELRRSGDRAPPGHRLDPDSDLGDRLVTVSVGPLPPTKRRRGARRRPRARPRLSRARADRRCRADAAGRDA